MVADLLKSVQQELERTQTKGTSQQEMANIDTLILLDRNVDLVTPLSTQLTYEGLIDEIYGIEYCMYPHPLSLSTIHTHTLLSLSLQACLDFHVKCSQRKC